MLKIFTNDPCIRKHNLINSAHLLNLPNLATNVPLTLETVQHYEV